jgi:hypothetical protein
LLPRRGRFARANLLLALATVGVAGCALLWGPAAEAPDFAEPSPLATYTSGSATITLGDGTKIKLAKLHGEAALYKTEGATVSWENDDGWYLHLSANSDVPGLSGAYLTIDRIHDGEHWATRDPGRCIVDVTKLDATGLKGSATCKGLAWQDALSGYPFAAPSNIIPGQKPFDATIAFEARP